MPGGKKSGGRVTGCRKTGGGTKGGEDFGKNRETGKIGEIGRYGKPPLEDGALSCTPFPRLSTLQGEEKAPPRKTAGAGSGPE